MTLDVFCSCDAKGFLNRMKYPRVLIKLLLDMHYCINIFHFAFVALKLGGMETPHVPLLALTDSPVVTTMGYLCNFVLT